MSSEWKKDSRVQIQRVKKKNVGYLLNLYTDYLLNAFDILG